MLGEHLQKYDFEYLKRQALDQVPNFIDKRQGSIIYDTISPGCYNQAELFMELGYAYLNTSPYTATGEYLDDIVINKGLTRYKATKAIKKAIFEFNGISKPIPIGARFSTIDDLDLIYKVVSLFSENNTYLLECEEEGTIGNSYTGDLLPITHINNLTRAEITSLITPARDLENDEDLRSRYFQAFEEEPFGGNIADYRLKVGEIEGVGAIQVYPTWNGGGTCKCSVVDTEYNPVSTDFLKIISDIIDPENAEGEKGTGLGKAPIGHKVTIDTPQEVILNISANVELDNGYTLDIVKPVILTEIKKYILSAKKNWGVPDDLNKHKLNIYVSRITSSMLNVDGISNITNVQINNAPNDINLIQTATLQQIPKIGDLVLNE